MAKIKTKGLMAVFLSAALSLTTINVTALDLNLAARSSPAEESKGLTENDTGPLIEIAEGQEQVREAADLTSGTYQPISGYALPNGVTALTTLSPYGWSPYNFSPEALISGNQYVSNSVSSLKVTVTGSGVLTYQYRVYSNSIDYKKDDNGQTRVLSEDNPDSLLITVGREIVPSDSILTDGEVIAAIAGRRYYGYTGWQSGTIKIDAAEGETTDIYFTYKKNGSGDDEIDRALLKDLSFNTGEATIAANASDATYGTVSGGGTYYAGETVTLTATPKSGGKFYGWARDGVLTSEEGTTYSFIAGVDVTVTAVFGSESDTVAQNHTTGAVYTDVKAAIDDSHPFETLVLLEDTVLTSDATIPANVTLYIPYSAAFNSLGYADGTTSNYANIMAPEEMTFCSLTINSGVTLDIKGKLLVGGVISYPSQQLQGHTSGYHGRITNNGKITVSGGRIDCYGFIDGTGTLDAVTGNVYEPFIVLDFAGGNNLARLFYAGQNSFRDYTMQNISCTLVIHSSAALNAYCNLYASSEYNKTDLAIIGGQTTAPNGLIVLKDGATATRTVDKTKSLSGVVSSGSYASNIGKVEYTLSGGASLNQLAISVYGISISVEHFPIPYSYSYTLTNGSYSMPTGWDIMPGAEFTVARSATLSVGGRFLVLDGLKAGDMSGKRYPSSEALVAAGYPTCGVLTVDGVLYLASGSTFGGIIQTNGTGTVHVPIGCTVETPSVQFGAEAYYDDNTCIMELDGRIRVGNELVTLQKGKIYSATNGNEWTLPGYTLIEYATDTTSVTEPTTGKYGTPSNSNYPYVIHAENETVTTNQSMHGTFAVSGNTEDFVSVCKTVYDPNDNTRTTVSVPTISNKSVSFTVDRTAAGKSYNFLVQYSINGGDPVTISPDKTTGVYTINDVSGVVTVTVIAVKKGDVDLDGDITAADVTKLRRSLAKYEVITNAFSLRAADCDSDTDVTAADVTLLRRFLAKYITEL